MTLEDLQVICRDYMGVTEDIKWDDHLCFNVAEKMFLITSPDQVPIPASFKVSEEDFGYLTTIEGFSPAPYLARYKWIRIDDISRLSKNEWEHYIHESYKLVASKLPLRLRNEINIAP